MMLDNLSTIDEALCMGTGNLAVDAVLLIGEHGNYPVNALGQREYPRKRFFDETVALIKENRAAWLASQRKRRRSSRKG